MESKYTPGPWVFLAEWGEIRDAETFTEIARMPELDDRPEDFTLMTAAPLMYEALANIENDDGSIPPAIWAMRNKALAAARGEANNGTETEAWEKASVARLLKRNAELTSNVVELVKAATQARSAISRGLYSVAAKRLDPYAAWDEDADGYEQF